jgi:hypothetical protein
MRRVVVQYLLKDGEVDKFFPDFRAAVPQKIATYFMESHVPGFPGRSRVTLSAVAGDFGEMLVMRVNSGLLWEKWGRRQIGHVFTTCEQVVPTKISISS